MEKTIEKECKRHGLSTHVLRPTTNSYRCRKCASENVTKRRREIKAKAVQELGGKCSICGYCKSKYALDFHHLDASTKSFNISEKAHSKSWEKVAEEIAKCILVCRNCHSEIHENEYLKTHTFDKNIKGLDKPLHNIRV